MSRAVANAVSTGWDLPSLVEDAELVVSELVGNPIEHAAGSDSSELELLPRPTGVRICLADGSSAASRR